MTFGTRRAEVRAVVTLAAIGSLAATSAPAQTQGGEPVAQRAGREFGCFITAREGLGALPRDSALYWHIDRFPTPAAAEAARGARSTVAWRGPA